VRLLDTDHVNILKYPEHPRFASLRSCFKTHASRCSNNRSLLIGIMASRLAGNVSSSRLGRRSLRHRAKGRAPCPRCFPTWPPLPGCATTARATVGVRGRRRPQAHRPWACEPPAPRFCAGRSMGGRPGPPGGHWGGGRRRGSASLAGGVWQEWDALSTIGSTPWIDLGQGCKTASETVLQNRAGLLLLYDSL
jgi:hypothetical protein